VGKPEDKQPAVYCVKYGVMQRNDTKPVPPQLPLVMTKKRGAGVPERIVQSISNVYSCLHQMCTVVCTKYYEDIQSKGMIWSRL
jgi:hypothetical protein